MAIGPDVAKTSIKRQVAPTVSSLSDSCLAGCFLEECPRSHRRRPGEDSSSAIRYLFLPGWVYRDGRPSTPIHQAGVASDHRRTITPLG